MYSTAVLKIDDASKIRANWLKIPRNSAIFGQNSANFRQFTHINFNLFHYAGNNPVKYVDPDGRAPFNNGVYDGKYNQNKKLPTQVCGPQLPKAELKNGVSTPVGSTYDDAQNVTSEFGPDRPVIQTNDGQSTLPGHNGMDFAAPEGTRINAVMDGTVTYVDKQGNTSYGKVLVITHKNGTQTLYAHQSKIDVNQGDYVEAGQAIGEVGSTGKSTGPHLHLGFDGNKDKKFERTEPADDPARLLYSGEGRQ